MRPKLLLADDSVTIQRVIELTFADEDVQVVAVGDGQQAIDRVRSDRPDIVLADIGMPGRDGYEVAAFIKGDPELAHIPVLLLTGAFEPIDEARARAVGCDGVLVKPFEPQMVISRVRELLAGKRDGASTTSTSVAGAGAVPEPPTASAQAAASLEDYFDRLDAALATKGAPAPTFDPIPAAVAAPTVAPRPSLTIAPPAVATSPSPNADPESSEWPPAAPAQPVERALPSAHVEHREAPPAPVAHEPPAVQPKPVAPAARSVIAAPPAASPVNPAASFTPVTLDQAFVALLAAEQGQALAAPRQVQAPARDWPDPVPDSVIETVVNRVIARMGTEPMRAAVLDAAERLVREEIDRIKNVR